VAKGSKRTTAAGNASWWGDPDEGYAGDDWSRGGWSGFFPASRPLAVSGGIKARSRRGSFGESWWARRWIEVLEGFRIGGRLQRGKSYARSGQVVSVEIENGRALATVQGSRGTPYSVAIALRPLTDAAWKKVARELRRRPILTAMLASGALHPQVEDVFESAGLSLFPTGFGELSTKCSCPDWSNPCKHVAAVFYLMAEELDRDGMLLLRLRGIERDHIAQIVRPRAGARPAASTRPARPAPVSLPTAPADFWARPAATPDVGDVATPAGAAGLVMRLGSFPLWRGSEPFLETMQARYDAASTFALELAGRVAGAEARSDAKDADA
jgi:uncharacterized Zn finger protein